MKSWEKVREDIQQVLVELIEAGNVRAGQWIVIGASTSEVVGQRIGTAGALEAAKAIFEAAAMIREQHAVHFAFQCCEHLNRALVVERAAMEQYALDEVSVIPVAEAGGSMAAYAYRQLAEPCVVEAIRAHAAVDIGTTLIGMHLRPVAVPFRPSVKTIGHAFVTAAYTRPKLIGGARAKYTLQ